MLALAAVAKPRLFVLTDLANESDDEESLVRLLVYANEFDIEGLVATTSCYLKKGPREDLLRKAIDAYAEVRGNPAVHAEGFPTADALRKVTASGQPGYGMTSVDAATPGSLMIDFEGKVRYSVLVKAVPHGGDCARRWVCKCRRLCPDN